MGGLCPGNCESAGKRKTGKTRKGTVYLRRSLCQAAWAASHTKDSFLTALFYRFAARGGVKKATIAVAHRLIVIADYLLAERTVYKELGGDYFDRLHPERTTRRLVRRLERLGHEVVLQPRTEPPRPRHSLPFSNAAAVPVNAPNAELIAFTGAYNSGFRRNKTLSLL